MYTDVYADVLFLINFSMDTISLYVTARLCAAKISAKRIALGGIIGGFYSVVSLLLGLNFYIEIAVFLLVCLLMCSVSLFPDGFASSVKYSVVMFVSSSLLGGVMTAAYGAFSSLFGGYVSNAETVSINPLVFSLLACASIAAALFLCSLHGSGNMPDGCELSIKMFDKELKIQGIFDSGNMLKDSLSGRAVIVIQGKKLSGVLSNIFLEGARRSDTNYLYSLPAKEKKRFRLIPSSSIGGSTYLWGIIPDDIKLVYKKHSKEYTATREAVIALYFGRELEGDVKCIVPQSII